MNARMSFFVTRPPCPVPVTALGSTPCWAAIRATTGETKLLPFPLAASAGAADAAAGAGCSVGAAATGSGTAAGEG